MDIDTFKGDYAVTVENTGLKNKLKFWKKLDRNQKTSFLFFLFFLLAVPLASVAALSTVVLRQRAAEYPSTPPVLVPSPTLAPPATGAFALSLTNPKTDLLCKLGDQNCYFQTTLIAKNRTGKTLYNTTLYQSSPNNIMSFIGFDGNWTSNKSTTTKVVQPNEEAINTIVKVVPPNSLGKTSSTFYIDAQTCNTNVNPPDCYFYGASSFTVNLTVVETLPSISAFPTLIPSLPPPPSCLPINGVINVTPVGGSGTCHDLQEAINSVNGPNFTIRVNAGEYIIPNRGNFSLKIENKTGLTIEGDPKIGSGAVKIKFPQNNGGIYIGSSQGINLGWMEITGRTSNGLVSLYKTAGLNLHYAKLIDEGANTIQINFSSNVQINSCEVRSPSVAIYPSSSSGILIANNKVVDSSIGVEIGGSSGTIKYNLFENINESGIFVNDLGSTFEITNNTLIQKSSNYSEGTIINPTCKFTYNIVANTGTGTASCGLIIRNGTDSDFSNPKISFNDFYNQNRIFCSQQCPAGQCTFTNKLNGNISADPLFGPDYCLKPGSPAVGMGYRGICSGTPTAVILTPTPTLPKPTIVPVNNKPPVISTNRLANATRNKTYMAFVRGHDPNRNNTLNMRFYNLPQGLITTPCNSYSDPKNNWKQISCGITGAPKVVGTFQITVVLEDNWGALAKRILPLKILPY